MEHRKIVNNILKHTKNRPSGYYLNILAEECSELSHAALKLQRAWKGDTPKSIKECERALIEEMVDVTISLMLVSEKYNIPVTKFREILDNKIIRLFNRTVMGSSYED